MIKGCHKVHLSPTDEDMEGSFDDDVLIGNGRANSMLGQPGAGPLLSATAATT